MGEQSHLRAVHKRAAGLVVVKFSSMATMNDACMCWFEHNSNFRAHLLDEVATLVLPLPFRFDGACSRARFAAFFLLVERSVYCLHRMAGPGTKQWSNTEHASVMGNVRKKRRGGPYGTAS